VPRFPKSIPTIVMGSDCSSSIWLESTKDCIDQRVDRTAIPAEAIGRAIAFAIDQPDDVDVNEIIVRPTASPY